MATYRRLGLTGGASGSLDALDGTALASIDVAIVLHTDDKVYFYKLDPSSGAAESSPDIISPDTNAGTKRWVLCEVAGLATPVTDVTATAPIVSSGGTTPAISIDLATPGNIGETAPGTVRGNNKEIFKPANGTLTAAECAGTIVSNYGMTDADCTIDLPTAAAGLAFVCILPAVRARFFKLHCPTAQSDKIYLLGVAGSDDGNVGVASGYLTGASCSMFTFKASDGNYDWFCIPIYGNWIAS